MTTHTTTRTTTHTTTNAGVVCKTIVLVGLGATALAACGSSTDQPAAAAPAEQTAVPVTAVVATARVSAKSANTAIGEVLTDTEGLTLYGFTNDADATSTCYGTCADAWPPVIVATDFTVGPGLDVGIFATAKRDDGQLQLVAGKFPLYTFAADAVPGDVKGQASGDVWFAVDTTGILRDDPAPAEADDNDDSGVDAIVGVGSTDLGDIVVDTDGLSLYGFTNDADGTPTCNDACADAWPPLLVDSENVPDGLDTAVFSVVERTDGSFQLKAGKWPLYRFAADATPGDIKGQASGDVWFLVAADGSLVKN